jgi:hypothetical protein
VTDEMGNALFKTRGAHRLAPVRNVTLIILRVVDLVAALLECIFEHPANYSDSFGDFEEAKSL